MNVIDIEDDLRCRDKLYSKAGQQKLKIKCLKYISVNWNTGEGSEVTKSYFCLHEFMDMSILRKSLKCLQVYVHNFDLSSAQSKILNGLVYTHLCAYKHNAGKSSWSGVLKDQVMWIWSLITITN